VGHFTSQLHHFTCHGFTLALPGKCGFMDLSMYGGGVALCQITLITC